MAHSELDALIESATHERGFNLLERVVANNAHRPFVDGVGHPHDVVQAHERGREQGCADDQGHAHDD